jgi:hypothetical protein
MGGKACVAAAKQTEAAAEQGEGSGRQEGRDGGHVSRQREDDGKAAENQSEGAE